MLRIPSEPRTVETLAVPGLSAAHDRLKAKVAALNEAQAHLPEEEQVEYSIVIGVYDAFEIRKVKYIPLEEKEGDQAKLLQEVAQELIQRHQKDTKARYKKTLQDLMDGKITLERAQEILPEHTLRELSNVRKQIRAEVEK